MPHTLSPETATKLDTTMFGVVDHYAGATPAAPAAWFANSRSTYRELAASTWASARSLHAAGVRRGDHVGIFLLESSEPYLSLGLGAMRLGAVCVPINARFKARELSYVANHAALKLLVTAPALQPIVAEAELPADCRVVVLGEDEAFRRAGDEVPAGVVEEAAGRVATTDPALLLYTSGTTAAPKGCVHSHVAAVAIGQSFADRTAMDAHDRFWTPLPMFHVGGWLSAFCAFVRGAAFVHPGIFDPAVAIAQLRDERCTLAFPAFETIWMAVLDHPDFDPAQLGSLRLIINVGVPERMRLMQERVPNVPQVSTTGSTECFGFLCLGHPGDSLHSRTHTSGRPLPGMEVRVIDPETGREAMPGEPGELQFRGVARFMHYHDDPEATSAAIDADGWFRSGDLVRQEPGGAIAFVGRLKDMLKVGGENVAAAEIEDFLLTHPAVHMAQVVAAPDARYGEVPAAFVVLKPGAHATEEELVDHCLGAIATFKVPRYVRFVAAEEIPMSGTAKVQKFRLRERIAAELEQAGIREAPKLVAARAQR